MEHGIILVLPHAIVGMQMDVSLAEAVLLKVMVEQAYDGVGSLPSGNASQQTPKIPLFRGVRKYTSKLKIFNKNCKGLGTTEKEKKQEETQTGR